MTRIVYPFPEPKYRKDFLPDARWWRLPLTSMNEQGHLYYITRDGGDDFEDTTYIEVSWDDGYNVVLDGGFDHPNVAAMCFSFRSPIEYIDLLMVNRPTPSGSWRCLTGPGDHEHPEVVDWPNEHT